MAAIEEAAHSLHPFLRHRDQRTGMSQDPPMCLTLRLYKNRDLVKVQDVQQQWNSGRWWEEVSGTLRKTTDNAFAKYEGYDVQELQIENADKPFQYTPTKVSVLWRIHPRDNIDQLDDVDDVDGAIKQHTLTLYETVQAHPPVLPLPIGGHRFVPCSLDTSSHQADISKLSKTVWKQLGQTGEPTILLLKMKKQHLSKEDVTVAKDDVTGDVYPYRITRVLYLTTQDRKDVTHIEHNADTSDNEPMVGWNVKHFHDAQDDAQDDAQYDTPHDIATLLAQGFLQRPSAQGMTKPLFLQGLQHNTLWPGYLSTYSPSTPWKPSLSTVFDTCAEMAQPVTGTQEFLFPFGAITCTAIQTPPPHPSITVHILKIATLKGVRDSVGIACRQTLDRWISKHSFETAEIHICSIGSMQWMDFLLKTGCGLL